MRSIKSEKGQGMVEYAFLFVTVVIIAAISFGNMSAAANRIYDKIYTVLIPAFS